MCSPTQHTEDLTTQEKLLPFCLDSCCSQLTSVCPVDHIGCSDCPFCPCQPSINSVSFPVCSVGTDWCGNTPMNMNLLGCECKGAGLTQQFLLTQLLTPVNSIFLSPPTIPSSDDACLPLGFCCCSFLLLSLPCSALQAVPCPSCHPV